MQTFDRAKAEALSRLVVAVIEHTDFSGVMTVVFDKAARADWMAFDVRHFPDVMVGNEWYQTAGSIGKKALGFDISVHPEDMKRAAEVRTAPTLPLGHAPANLYQFFMEKVRAGRVAHFAFAACDAAARQAAHDAIDAKCSGEALPEQQPWAERVQAPARSGQRTLMIVEDDPNQLDVFKAAAEARGWQVISVLMFDAHDKPAPEVAAKYSYVCDSKQALRNVFHAHLNPKNGKLADAVLSDFQLTYDVTGDDVVRIAKAVSSTYNRLVPVIGHSSVLIADYFNQDEAKHTQDAFERAGADDTLGKSRTTNAGRRDNDDARHSTLDRLIERYEAERRAKGGLGF